MMNYAPLHCKRSSSIYLICCFLSAVTTTNSFQNHHNNPPPTTSTSTTICQGKRTPLPCLFLSQHDNDNKRLNDPTLEQSIRSSLSKMKLLMEPNFIVSSSELLVSSSSSLQRLSKKMKKTVRVGPSSIEGAGVGLFAKTNIKRGTIISFFPVHGMGIDFGTHSICMGATAASEAYFADAAASLSKEEEGEGNNKKEEKANYLHYLIGNRSLIGCEDQVLSDPLFIDVDPNIIIVDNNDDSSSSSSCFNSHFVNDGAMVTENSERGALQYYDKTQRNKNCVNVPFGPSPILATVTTKKVKKGEELFTTYGVSYWIEQMIAEAEIMTDITEPIQVEVKRTAQDLFNAMKDIQVVYEKEGAQLQSLFEKI